MYSVCPYSRSREPEALQMLRYSTQHRLTLAFLAGADEVQPQLGQLVILSTSTVEKSCYWNSSYYVLYFIKCLMSTFRVL